MPDFGLTPHASLSPSQCIACQGQQDPAGFLDLVAEIPAYGRVYVCAGCVGMAASRLGWIEPRVAGELRTAASDAQAETRRLNEELARAEGRGTWTFEPDDESNELHDADPTMCPDCGGPKGATSKRCKPCSMNAARAAKAGATA